MMPTLHGAASVTSSGVSGTTGNVRLAEPRDVPALSAIRSALTLQVGTLRAGVAPRARGFLLGSAPETYAMYVAAGAVMVAEVGGRVVAYSVVLPDALLRRSEVYAKRNQAGLEPGLLEWLERSRVAYYDQLASLPGHAALAVNLAYRHLRCAIEVHDAVLATTVVEPVLNEAAVPLLVGVGFRPVGEVEEVYPEVGRIRSRVHAVTREAAADVRSTARALRFERRLAGT